MTITAFPNGVSSFGVPVIGGGASGLVAYKKVYFVDGERGSDGNSGLSVDTPFVTIQKAVDTVSHYDSIVVLGHVGGGDYDETVTTPQNQTSLSLGANYVTLYGASPGKWPYNAPQVFPNTDNGNCLVMRAPGWRVSGFRFAVPTTSTVCMQLNFNQAGRTVDTNWSPGTQIDNNVFLGTVAAGVGVDFIGAPRDVRILSNLFQGFTDHAITSSSAPITFPNDCVISYNSFTDCTHMISMDTRGFINSVISYNYFAGNHSGSNTISVVLDIRSSPGGGCAIFGNQFPAGDYSLASNRFGDSSQGGNNWHGNFSDDVGETEVDASGITVAPPAV